MAYVFIDRVLECKPGERVSALKALALNEEFFQDHFPGKPVLPGAMILEGFVQAVRHCMAALPGGHDQWLLGAVANVKFSRFAVPGEVLRLDLEREAAEDGGVWFRAQARVGEETVCRARLSVRTR
jgi:3-hydroxyacyl-[acyl-carrier-protein] dehydratase